MRVGRRDLDRAVARGVIDGAQAERLWAVLAEDDGGERPRFDLPHVAYYLGALVVISAMGWFMTLGWQRFGGGGILAISLVYAAVFLIAGAWMWRRRGLRTPGGLLVTVAVAMTPLAVYGLQEWVGVWPGGVPGDYRDFHAYVRGGWFPMEVATVAAGLLALRYFPFPFLTAPVAFALWYASMDLTPLLYGEGYAEAQGYQTVSLVVGLAMILGAYLVDRRTEGDYAFWGYLFGGGAFWGGLTLLEGGGEWQWALYAAINALLVGVSVLLQRRVFVVFGSAGLFAYVGHLSWEIFEDSILFPFALSAAGLAIIGLGIAWAKNRDAVERAVVRAVPGGLRRLLPAERE